MIPVVVVVYHITIVAIGHGLLKKFWPFGKFVYYIFGQVETMKLLVWIVNLFPLTLGGMGSRKKSTPTNGQAVKALPPGPAPS